MRPTRHFLTNYFPGTVYDDEGTEGATWLIDSELIMQHANRLIEKLNVGEPRVGLFQGDVLNLLERVGCAFFNTDWKVVMRHDREEILDYTKTAKWDIPIPEHITTYNAFEIVHDLLTYNGFILHPFNLGGEQNGYVIIARLPSRFCLNGLEFWSCAFEPNTSGVIVLQTTPGGGAICSTTATYTRATRTFKGFDRMTSRYEQLMPIMWAPDPADEFDGHWKREFWNNKTLANGRTPVFETTAAKLFNSSKK